MNKLFSLFCLLCIISYAACASEATYRFSFTPVWTDSTVDNEHFSPPIGCAHVEGSHFWTVGEMASTGVQAVAETGSQSPLNSEIMSLVNSGIAKQLVADSNVAIDSPSNTARTLTFTVSKQFPVVSIISMIAPSPDWFIGVDSLSLVDDDGNYHDSIEFESINSYDAGTDSGSTFTAADQVTQPQDVIRSLSQAEPDIEGPFATWEFTLLSVEGDDDDDNNNGGDDDDDDDGINIVDDSDDDDNDDDDNNNDDNNDDDDNDDNSDDDDDVIDFDDDDDSDNAMKLSATFLLLSIIVLFL